MFQLFKGISTKSLLITILILSLAGLGTWKLYKASLVENGGLKAENATLQQNVDYVEQSIKITDSVTNNHVVETQKQQKDTLTLRKEAINEYVKKIEPVVPAKTSETKSTIPDGADRVGILADRLHENYCRSRPEDSRCNTNPINK